MYNIELTNQIYEYMISKLDKEISQRIKDVKNEGDRISFNVDVDTKLDIMEFVEDKQLEIGFVNQDYLNEDGKKLQIIYDEIYYQTNN